MTKIAALLLIIPSLIFLYSGCDETIPLPDNTYQYSGYSADGTPIVEGWFTIIESDTFAFTGIWDFDKIGEPEDIGDQIGTDSLVGTIDGNNIWINLNPGFVDNNVNLFGTISENQIVGEWIWSGFAGILNQGTFIAKQE